MADCDISVGMLRRGSDEILLLGKIIAIASMVSFAHFTVLLAVKSSLLVHVSAHAFFGHLSVASCVTAAFSVHEGDQDEIIKLIMLLSWLYPCHYGHHIIWGILIGNPLQASRVMNSATKFGRRWFSTSGLVTSENRDFLVTSHPIEPVASRREGKCPTTMSWEFRW